MHELTRTYMWHPRSPGPDWVCVAERDGGTYTNYLWRHNVRTFETGATRDTEVGKYDYEGFLSPLVLQRFAGYMHRHREQADGQLRDSDNWQKGIPRDAYMKSILRHVMDLWLEHDGYQSREGAEDALCAILFNAQGYLHEILKGR